MKDGQTTPLLAGGIGQSIGIRITAYAPQRKTCVVLIGILTFVAFFFLTPSISSISMTSSLTISSRPLPQIISMSPESELSYEGQSPPESQTGLKAPTFAQESELPPQSKKVENLGRVPRIRGTILGPESIMKNDNTRQNFGCAPVLERAVVGKWVPRQHTTIELNQVERFINRTHTAHKLPLDLERLDKRCGNTNMAEKGRSGGLSWYRALCNPRGPKPCCYSNHTCVALSEAQCRCDGCHDMRQPIHAELHTWKPTDTKCHLREYLGEEDICPLLKNVTIHTLGDSFLRQIYISLLELLRSEYPQGSVKDETLKKDEVEKCDDYYRYFSKCSTVIPMKAWECNNTVLMMRDSKWKLSQKALMFKLLQQHIGKENHFVLMGFGIHDMYNPDATIERVLQPLVDMLKPNKWPHFIWVAPHAPGLLKTPLVTKQGVENVRRYNAKVTPFMKSNGIPVLDGMALSKDNIMSYDGTHYGRGLNDVKAQIILNHISEFTHR